MHAILASLGTDGDVIPYLGLGSILRGRGHRVTLAVPETYRTRAEQLGFDFQPLVTTAEIQQMLSNPDLWHPLRSGPMMARWGSPLLGRHYQLLADLAAQPKSILVANPGVLTARVVQEKLGTPMATLLLQPGLVSSISSPPALFGGLTLPRGMPRAIGELYWAAVDAAGFLLVAGPLNRLRKQLGLNPIRRLFRWWFSPQLVIGLFPAWFAPPQPDWPPQLRLAGFGRSDGAINTTLAEELISFCTDNQSPIVFTLGTGMLHGRRFFQSAIQACQHLGIPGLLLNKYSHQIPQQLPPSVRHVAYAPFRQLLPICGALVHHGGIGTTGAALASGIPQLILPLAWDQYDNAARVGRLGVGSSLPQRQRSGKHLAQALTQLHSPRIRQRSQQVAELANEPNGLEIAADWIEKLVPSS